MQNQEQLEATLNTATQIRQDVSQMQTAVAEAKKQVEQDKKDIDDTIQNSLLASAEKILESVQDYFNRAEALYSSMYLDCELHAEHYMRYMDDMVILGKSKKKLHKIHAAIETYLNDNLDLEIKGDWQVFRFEYPVFDKSGNPVLNKDGKQVTKGRMLDFMGFQFHHDRTTIRKSNIEAARRKANHISKQDKISWYNASVMLSYMGLFKHTDTYNYYIDYIKPKINVKKLKRIVSKHSRKENEHDRLEKGDRNTAGQAGGGRQDIVAVNGLPA